MLVETGNYDPLLHFPRTACRRALIITAVEGVLPTLEAREKTLHEKAPLAFGTGADREDTEDILCKLLLDTLRGSPLRTLPCSQRMSSAKRFNARRGSSQ
ncbi:hypothetical protein NMY22_g12001 [Coprinellus aureogranulatus]|nr:hypothetical protein NMY22_g12001 [Coprinellus aureogranulatus]